MNYDLIRCKQGYTFGVFNNLLDMPDELGDKLCNLILERLLFEPKCNKHIYWHFYYDPDHLENDQQHPEKVNLAHELLSYPNNFIELANRTLINLSRLHPKFGEVIASMYTDCHAAFCIGRNAGHDAYDFFDLMVDLNYLSKKDDLQYCYFISANGWKKVEELRKKQQEVNQGFIAISFRDETKPIREAFREAINSTGFATQCIDEKEHNNQIVPEIFYEIQRSKFVVVDVTYPNYGAYYEAGYAQGLGKEVIVCCRETEFYNISGEYIRPHFDISQKSMIIWKNADDLISRLEKRIKATVR
jgi:nucleoside 2-deoxyribosyltransferase